ncbi:MAG: NUDIX domain-containing protein [bacterium]
MQRRVVLVDKNDQELGTAEIFNAHQGKGLKHRALSVVLYRPTSSLDRLGTSLGIKKSFEVLLQKRSAKKPVFRRLWGNTCCTNLRPGDEYIPRAVSRLKEEMGIEIEENDLQILYRFSYEAPDREREDWCENELDTVIIGKWDPPSRKATEGQGVVNPNPNEVSDWRWMEWGELEKEIENHPNEYVPWLKMIVEDGRVKKKLYEGRKDGRR